MHFWGNIKAVVSLLHSPFFLVDINSLTFLCDKQLFGKFMGFGFLVFLWKIFKNYSTDVQKSAPMKILDDFFWATVYLASVFFTLSSVLQQSKVSVGESYDSCVGFFFNFSKTILGNQRVKVQSKKEAISVFLALTATSTFCVKEVTALENVQILNFCLYFFGNLLSRKLIWKNRLKVQSNK